MYILLNCFPALIVFQTGSGEPGPSGCQGQHGCQHEGGEGAVHVGQPEEQVNNFLVGSSSAHINFRYDGEWLVIIQQESLQEFEISSTDGYQFGYQFAEGSFNFLVIANAKE